HHGDCCLVTADKGWTHILFDALRERLRANGLRCEYIDGRPTVGESPPDDIGVMLTAIGQLRRAIRGPLNGAVVSLPHLDVMTASDRGWTNISREVVPLLYEVPQAVFLGFCDPALRLLAVVEKLFSRRYVLPQPFREAVTIGPLAAADATSPAEST